jgi:hypothetical protein
VYKSKSVLFCSGFGQNHFFYSAWMLSQQAWTSG